MERVKRAGAVAWLIGIAVFIGLIIWSGPHAVGHAVASVGWGLPLIVMARAGTLSLAGAGWWLLFSPQMRPALGTCVLLRFVREAGNVLLMQIAGDLIGARLLTLRGVSGPLAAASVIVDVLMQAATQFLFAVLGLLVLVTLGTHGTLARIVAIGLAIAAVMLVGFYLAQRRGGQRILRWAISGLTGDRKWRVLGTIDAVYENLAMIYDARSRIVASGVMHMGGWIVGVSEVWIVLTFMGNAIGIAEALVIESLLQAVRGAAFAIPSALGAQEGGLVLLCAVFGISPEQAVALSLAKRAADLVLGVPSLVAWQLLEWRGRKPHYSLAAGGQEASATPHSHEG